MLQETDESLDEPADDESADDESASEVDSSEHSQTQKAANQAGILNPQIGASGANRQWRKSVEALKSSTKDGAASLASLLKGVTAVDPPPAERGGRPYEALEELSGDDQDYVEHSEEVHMRVHSKKLVFQATAVVRGTRHSLLDMSTDEIDSLEEDTQRSAEISKQLFGLER